MSKKQLNQFKRELKAQVEKDLPAYKSWKIQIYQEPDGFLDNCEKNFQMLVELIPKEANSYFESPKNNPLIDTSHDVEMEEMQNRTPNMITDMVKYVPAFLEKLKSRFAENDSQLVFMYYWLLLDNGTIELKRLLCKHYCPNVLGFIGKPLFKMMIGIMVNQSIESYITSKKQWEKEEQISISADEKGAIAESLATTVSTNKGREDKDVALLDLLKGKKELLFDEIRRLVANRKSDSELGVMLYALEKSQCIVAHCDYTSFHRALQREFPATNIGGYDRPQQIYGKLRRNLVKDMKQKQKQSIQTSYKSFLTTFVELNS